MHIRASIAWTLAGAIVLLIGAMIFSAIRDSRSQQQQLQSLLSVQQQSIQAASQRQQGRDAQLASALATISQLKKRTQTPAQIIRELPQDLPLIPSQIQMSLPEATPLNPTPDAIARIPQSDLKPLFDSLQDCKAGALQLNTCLADRKDDGAKIQALTSERDAAVAASKQGSVWKRTKIALKWAAVGILIGYFAHR